MGGKSRGERTDFLAENNSLRVKYLEGSRLSKVKESY